MAGYKQATRPVRIETPLGEDVLLFGRMTGKEQLGSPFRYELVLFSERHDLDYRRIIGQPVTVFVDKGDPEPRYFNGYISRFARARFERHLCEYRATMVPWLWFLTESSDCRIFQNLTIPDIITQVFNNHGFPDFIHRLHGTYKPWEYCVQYRESAFNFVSRLMEQEGIYYFFKHQKDKHSLVLCDTIGSHLQFEGYEELHYQPSRQETSSDETLWSWVQEHEVQPGDYRVKDFDFKRPRREKVSAASLERGHSLSQMEEFEYLGEMDSESDGTRYVRLRMEQRQARHEVYTGEGDARGICTGVRFNLKRHPQSDLNKEYLTTGTEFCIESSPFESVRQAGNEFVYAAKLNAIPVTQEFRCPRVTPKPTIQGPQTAIVVGLSGEEIYTDKYGRVKVHFHWDRHGSADENASCWIRVAQVWAGKGWGSIYTPRVGQEVVVEFLEGDPDRPLITGRVYNDAALPPYDLPANKTISTHKSNSTKGGNGFNEIRFDDKKGEEQIFIRGEKNLDTRIQNDLFETVGNDRHLLVQKDKHEHVGNNRDEIVDADHKEKIGKDRHLSVIGKEAKAVGGSLSLSVEGDVIQVFKASHSEQVSGDYYLKADNVVIEGLSSVTIKVGQSYIAIDSNGIKISATQLEFEGMASAEMKSPATTVKADANLVLKGAMVMIN
jgi:type VI secretion system secreted protein VgrG